MLSSDICAQIFFTLTMNFGDRAADSGGACRSLQATERCFLENLH